MGKKTFQELAADTTAKTRAKARENDNAAQRAAGRLNPADQSDRARHVREVADMVADHRESENLDR
jgi:hypothetical protein